MRASGSLLTVLRSSFLAASSWLEKVKDGSAAIVILITEDRRLFVVSSMAYIQEQRGQWLVRSLSLSL